MTKPPQTVDALMPALEHPPSPVIAHSPVDAAAPTADSSAETM